LSPAAAFGYGAAGPPDRLAGCRLSRM